MKTKFDHFTDEQIATAAAAVDLAVPYVELDTRDDLLRIAHLSRWMRYWQAWLGPPLTYHESEGLEFDGQHRCRAAKFLARRYRLQILVPMRYDPRITEATK